MKFIFLKQCEICVDDDFADVRRDENSESKKGRERIFLLFLFVFIFSLNNYQNNRSENRRNERCKKRCFDSEKQPARSRKFNVAEAESLAF